MRQLAARVWADEIPDRAAALSYDFLFALFPALLFLTTPLGLVPVSNLMQRLQGYGAAVLPRTPPRCSPGRSTRSCGAPGAGLGAWFPLARRVAQRSAVVVFQLTARRTARSAR